MKIDFVSAGLNLNIMI